MGQIKTSISIEENVSSAFKSMNTVVSSTLNNFQSFNNVINDTPTMNNSNESILNSINNASNDVAESMNNMNNAINSVGSINDSGSINNLNAINEATSNVIENTEKLSNEYNNISPINNGSVSTLNEIATQANNASDSVQQLNNNIGATPNPNIDYWTDAVGHYSKSALEAVYTTEELVQMGFKTAEALQQPANSVEQINGKVTDLKNNISQWSSIPSIDIFRADGIERYELEMSSAADLAQKLLDTQKNIENQANNTKFVSQAAIDDLGNINTRMIRLQDTIQQLNDSGLNDVGADKVNSQIEKFRGKLNSAIKEQETLNEAMQNMDASKAYASYEKLNQYIITAENEATSLNNKVSSIKSNIDSWSSSSNIQFFNSSGVERYQQEIQSANTMSNKLLQTQMQIQSQANSTNILPKNAINDLNNINTRIDILRSKIQKIEDKKITTIGAEQVNGQIEELREKLNNALQAQENLNEAMQNMDASGANQAYLQLENNVRDTEKYIRDNTDEQGKFNNKIQEGNTLANNLGNTLKNAVKAYLGIQGIKKAFGFVQDVTDSANVQIQAETKLNTIANKRMHASVNQVNALKQQASELQKIGVIGDEVTISGQATLSTFLNSTKSVENLTGAMNNLLVYTNGVGASAENAVSIANQIGKAMANNSLSSLTRSGITITDEEEKRFKALTNEQEKAALLAQIITNNVGEMNEALANTPVGQQQQLANTWGDIKETIGYKLYPAIMKFFSAINANMPVIENFINGFANGLYFIIEILSNVINVVGAFGNFVSENWSIIEPIIWGIVGALAVYGAYLAITKGIEIASAVASGAMAVAKGILAAAMWLTTSATWAETTAQLGLNAAMYACPLVWILILIIAVVAAIYAVIAAINKVTGSSISATGVIVGALTTAVAFIWNLFLGLLDLILGIVNYLGRIWTNFANFFGNLFNDPIASIIHGIEGMANTILSIVKTVASALDKVFGTSLASGVEGWMNNISTWANNAADKYGNRSYEKKTEWEDLSSESLGLNRWAYGDAFNTGYSWGEGIEDSIGNMFSMDNLNLDSITGLDKLSNSDATNMANNIADTANNTGKIADKMDITEEDLKYLRDIAEQEVINRYTTTSINVEMNNNNNITKEADLDGIVSGLEERIYEMSNAMAEGVHS